jgi:hypothetical protein
MLYKFWNKNYYLSFKLELTHELFLYFLITKKMVK